MEDVLELYAEPFDERRPVVGFDETSKQLIAETRQPQPMRSGQVARFDYEYERNGTRNLFMFCEPRRGWRHLEVTNQRTTKDFACQMKWLVDEAYPQAEVIRLVMDNLNTPNVASLYETFAPAEARRIARKLEIHYTPKHGSWLNIAGIELGIFARQCRDRRIGDEATPEARDTEVGRRAQAPLMPGSNGDLRLRMRGASCIVSTLQLQADGVVVLRLSEDGGLKSQESACYCATE